MYWIITLIVCIALGITFAILSHFSNYHDFSFSMISNIAFVCAIIPVFVIPLCWVQENQKIGVFEQQKQYIESHQTSGSIEDAALTAEKVKLNKTLYDAQYEINHYDGWNFYPSETKDLKPIK